MAGLLSYLQFSEVSNDNDDGYGTTYWLDFQAFNGNNMNRLYEPGTCGNRLESSYYQVNNQSVLRNFSEWWSWSDRQYINGYLGDDDYLAYPPPGMPHCGF